jgi:hypothetical protein
MYDWKQNNLGNTYLKASIPNMIEEIREKFEKSYATPGTPGKTLWKNEETMVDLMLTYLSLERSCTMQPR